MYSNGVANAQEGSIPAAVNWIETALLGSVATSIAVIAIAALGVSMLWGNVNVRAAGRLVFGAFVLFGAPLLALQLSAALRTNDVIAPTYDRGSVPAYTSPAMPKNAPVQDPYAGAAVPQLQQ